MTRTKVAHVTTIDMSLRYLLLNQLISLQQHGYEIVGISAAGENVATLEANGIRHLAVPITRKFSPVADLLVLLELVRVMRREQFSIVHTHTPKPGLLGQLAARLARVPIVINTVHGYYFHENSPASARLFFLNLERLAARLSSLIFFVNREDMATAVQEHICPSGKMSLLGPGGIGINVSRIKRERVSEASLTQNREQLGLQPHTPVVGFVGRLVEEKGIPELLQAARIVHTAIPEARFLFIGPKDEDKADAISPEIAQKYGVAKICMFTGLRHDIPELMALMNVFVLPSHREGFPVSIMEAAAMSLPCVVTNVRGCREAVEHGRNGLLVPLGDVDALAAAIIELLTDKEKARRMGEEGRKMAEERFDEQIVFAKVKAEYARLLRQKGLPVPGEAGAAPLNGDGSGSL
jgi:glycosyltransferase involved in cell wall biosynthesis